MSRRERFILRALAIGLLIAALSAPSASAASLCDDEYEIAVLALSKAQLPQGTQQKLVSKVYNARRMSRSAAANGRTRAVQQLEQALQLIDSNATKSVAAETRAKLRTAIDGYAGCLRSAPALQVVQMTVRALLAADGGTPAPAEGVEVRVDGESAGKTKKDGTLVVPVTAGEHTFAAVSSAAVGASAFLDVTAPATVDLVLAFGGDYSVTADLQVDELTDNVLQPSAATVTARFLDSDLATVKLKTLDRVELSSTSSDIVDLGKKFTVKAQGEIVSNDVAGFKQLLNDRYGPFELLISATGNDGRVYRNKVRFDLGRYRASGAIGSPSAVSVPLSDIPVRFTNDRSGQAFWATTGANGTVALPGLMPEGVYLVWCETVHQNVRYYCADAFVLNADRNFTMRLFALAGPAAEPISAATTEQGR
jgi:hypothetical protein